MNWQVIRYTRDIPDQDVFCNDVDIATTPPQPVAYEQVLAEGSQEAVRAAYRLITGKCGRPKAVSLPVLDAAYWKTRAFAAENELRRLRMMRAGRDNG